MELLDINEALAVRAERAKEVGALALAAVAAESRVDAREDGGGLGGGEHAAAVRGDLLEDARDQGVGGGAHWRRAAGRFGRGGLGGNRGRASLWEKMIRI